MYYLEGFKKYCLLPNRFMDYKNSNTVTLNEYSVIVTITNIIVIFIITITLTNNLKYTQSETMQNYRLYFL